MLDRELTPFFPGAPSRRVSIDHDFKRPSIQGLVENAVEFVNTGMDRLGDLGLDSLVVGLSGGVDSAVACGIAQGSRYPAMALILEMDDEHGLSPDVRASIRVAETLGIPHEVVNAAAVYREHLELFESNSTVARVHLRSRVITNVIFQYADNRGSAVIDTTDRSEQILAIYEESFRGHLAPLAGFFKSELFDVADMLGLHELRAIRSGCPELIDFDAFGMEWEDLDALLHLMSVVGMSTESIASQYGVDRDWLAGLVDRIERQPLRTTPAKLLM
jgi:NH3-dependent NAD+ synthetase